MSVAFTKEGDTENAAAVDLPDRPISSHPNLVTPRGLALIETALAKAREDYAANQAGEGRDGDRRALARAARDLRYYAARLATARVMPPASDVDVVRFGTRVTIERADGRSQTLRVVGEDEADPATGTVSYASPLASALMGKGEGDSATINGAEVEILTIEA
jgi:transcription elongation GreA/GreB family factor